MQAVLHQRIAMVIGIASKYCVFFTLLFSLQQWWLPGQYGVSSHLMVASKGFWFSPGHIASSHTVQIAPTCLHGHQNDPRWRHIHSLLLLFLFDVIVAKDHVMVHSN
jgi:hypothetical protein